MRQWVKLAVALLVLNAALTFHNVWPTLWVTVRGELSVEIGVLLLALVGVDVVRCGRSAAEPASG